MESSLPKPKRPWRAIAHDLTHEMDLDKVVLLSQELNRALALGLRADHSNRTEDEKKVV
jgi:hypothetical protein